MEPDKKEERLKGIYLVPDPLMMKPHFGPSEHIKVGLIELKKYFDIEIVVLGKYNFEIQEKKNARISTKNFGINNGFIGLFRDVKLLYKSNQGTKALKRQFRRRRIDFIYERGQYLDLRGVVIANELGIKHFYEVNWLNFLGIRQFYKSWFNSVARKIEEWAYKRSSLNFFIGTQHTLINIPHKKVHTIQNGIDQALLDANANHLNILNGKIRICYVANLMPHHCFDVFIDALKISKVSDKFELHMIGYNFESFQPDLPRDLSYILHGPKDKSELPAIMGKCNIGLISGGPSYSSFMKLFEYAAFKMCVICPDLENVRLMFQDDEIQYFDIDNAVSLANRLVYLSERSEVISRYGENIYRKVIGQYTWEKIYEDVSIQIKKRLSQ